MHNTELFLIEQNENIFIEERFALLCRSSLKVTFDDLFIYFLDSFVNVNDMR